MPKEAREKALMKFVTTGFRHGVNEFFVLLACYAAYIGSYLPTFRENLSVLYSRALDCLSLEDGTDRLSRNFGK
jgi:hypothetical protein